MKILKFLWKFRTIYENSEHFMKIQKIQWKFRKVSENQKFEFYILRQVTRVAEKILLIGEIKLNLYFRWFYFSKPISFYK